MMNDRMTPWPAVFVTTVWGASLAIPLGLASCAESFTSFNLWIAVAFVIIASLMGFGFSWLGRPQRGDPTDNLETDRRGSSPCLPLLVGLTSGMSIGLGIGLFTGFYRLPLAFLVSGVVFWLVADRISTFVKQSIDGFPYRPRFFNALVIMAAFVVLTQIGRFSLFMVNPDVRAFGAIPFVGEPYRHQCLAAYVHAALLNEKGVDNLYDPSWYDPSFPSEDPTVKAEPILQDMKDLLRDLYQYPPQALLWPTLGVKLTKSYPALRVGWFAVQACVIALLLLLIARAAGRGSPLLTLVPLLWVSMPYLTDLNYGQPHFLVVSLAAASTVLFDQKRIALGGLLLALAISIKIYPVTLAVLLLGQRRFGALATTVAWSALLASAALPIVGWGPYVSFFEYKAMQIIGGTAWKAYLGGELFGTGQLSVFGILLSLRKFSDGFERAAPYGLWLYNIALLLLIAIASRRKPSFRLGLALINLTASAGYYTPPSYAMTGTILLLILSFDSWAQRFRNVIVGMLLWGFLCFAAFPQAFPIPGIWGMGTFREVLTIIGFFTVATMNVAVVWTLPKRAGNPHD